MDTIIRPATPSSKRGPNRRHSDEFKRAAVARTLAPDASVSRIARELEINSNQLFNWRKRFAAEVALSNDVHGQLLPVTVIDTPTAATPLASKSPGVIVLTIGRAQLRLEDQADPATLALLLARLLP